MASAFVLFSEILELRGEKHLLLAGYGILDIVSIVILLILLNTGNTTTALSLSLVLGTAAGGIVLGILACLRMKTWPDLLRTLAIPAGSCCACGLLAFGLEKICLPIWGDGNGAAGTGDHRCGLLVFAFDVTQFPWTGSELCSRR